MNEITILGRGPSWTLCPFSGEIWATSSVLLTDKMKNFHYNKVFAFDPGEMPEVAEVLEIAKERNIPVVSTQPYATEQYPIWGILHKFGCQYFLNSASYMIALAIYMGYNHINLYGFDQTDGKEEGQPYVAFWLGVAVGRGMSFTNPSATMPHFIPDNMREKIQERIYAKGEYRRPCVEC